MHLSLSKKEIRQYFVLSGIAIALGIISGFVAIAFRYLIEFMQDIFYRGNSIVDNEWRLLIIFIPALGGLITGLIIHLFASEAKGHGIPEVMEAVLTKKGLIRPRVVFAKAFASAVTIASGGSAGREGPIVQIGSAVGSFLAYKLKLPPWMIKIMVGCGAAGALAATFNAPIAGVIFALELIVPEFKTRSFIPLAISSVFATVISRVFLEDVVAFPVPAYTLNHPAELGLYILLGILAGVMAVLFIKTLYHFEDVFDGLNMPPYLKPVLGGLMVGSIGLFFPQVLGLGYDTIEMVMTFQDPQSFLANILPNGGDSLWMVFVFILLFLLLKLLATSLTIGSGGSGGVFVPSLFVGAMLGGAFGIAAEMIMPAGMVASPGAYALVGMAAVFAGASRATLTAIIILFEMTLNYDIILPLILSCVIADAISLLIYKETIYTKKLMRKGIRYEYDRVVSPLRTNTVSHVMVKKVECVSENETILGVSDMIIKTGYQAFPVKDTEGKLTGMIAHHDVRKAIEKGMKLVQVKDLKTKDLITVSPNDDVELAMELMATHSVGHLPVVNPEDKTTLLGFISRSDVMCLTKECLEDEKDIED